jgi:hypothetical protein
MNMDQGLINNDDDHDHDHDYDHDHDHDNIVLIHSFIVSFHSWIYLRFVIEKPEIGLQLILFHEFNQIFSTGQSNNHHL